MEVVLFIVRIIYADVVVIRESCAKFWKLQEKRYLSLEKKSFK